MAVKKSTENQQLDFKKREQMEQQHRSVAFDREKLAIQASRRYINKQLADEYKKEMAERKTLE